MKSLSTSYTKLNRRVYSKNEGLFTIDIKLELLLISTVF